MATKYDNKIWNREVAKKLAQDAARLVQVTEDKFNVDLIFAYFRKHGELPDVGELVLWHINQTDKELSNVLRTAGVSFNGGFKNPDQVADGVNFELAKRALRHGKNWEKVASDIFKGEKRIEIRPSAEDIKAGVEDSKIAPAIIRLVQKLGYTDIDYINNMCRDARKNPTKLSTVLKSFTVLSEKFQKDPCRQLAGLKIVVSRHPYDLIRMSHGRGWSSCMNATDGCNRHYLDTMISGGCMVAYITSDSDPNLIDPLSRYVLRVYKQAEKFGEKETKPAKGEKKSSQNATKDASNGYIWRIGGRCYGIAPNPRIYGMLANWLDELNAKAPTGKYRALNGQYMDGDPENFNFISPYASLDDMLRMGKVNERKSYTEDRDRKRAYVTGGLRYEQEYTEVAAKRFTNGELAIIGYDTPITGPIELLKRFAGKPGEDFLFYNPVSSGDEKIWHSSGPGTLKEIPEESLGEVMRQRQIKFVTKENLADPVMGPVLKEMIHRSVSYTVQDMPRVLPLNAPLTERFMASSPYMLQMVNDRKFSAAKSTLSVSTELLNSFKAIFTRYDAILQKAGLTTRVRDLEVFVTAIEALQAKGLEPKEGMKQLPDALKDYLDKKAIETQAIEKQKAERAQLALAARSTERDNRIAARTAREAAGLPELFNGFQAPSKLTATQLEHLRANPIKAFIYSNHVATGLLKKLGDIEFKVEPELDDIASNTYAVDKGGIVAPGLKAIRRWMNVNNNYGIYKAVEAFAAEHTNDIHLLSGMAANIRYGGRLSHRIMNYMGVREKKNYEMHLAETLQALGQPVPAEINALAQQQRQEVEAARNKKQPNLGYYGNRVNPENEV